ncbi:hypothetical protein P154DRAFT_618025 [Amniculicola lignicola CBS 123094]|uniref:Uncharacterized protein n=1 Tax=Amniculicola lignicola CBS 123094 TaxID=1392246 RepID=A0A6A5WQG0_9PLEO|nr:hypothetical protein P154DRAFT_618025 [Amniculicola lignicola CBS 123094]
MPPATALQALPSSPPKRTKWHTFLLRSRACITCWIVITVLELLVKYLVNPEGSETEAPPSPPPSWPALIWQNLTLFRIFYVYLINFQSTDRWGRFGTRNMVAFGISMFWLREMVVMLRDMVVNIVEWWFDSGGPTGLIFNNTIALDKRWGLDWNATHKCARQEKSWIGRCWLMCLGFRAVDRIILTKLWFEWVPQARQWVGKCLEMRRVWREERRRQIETEEREKAEQLKKKKFADYLALLEARRREEEVASGDVCHFRELDGLSVTSEEIVEEPGWEDAFGDKR